MLRQLVLRLLAPAPAPTKRRRRKVRRSARPRDFQRSRLYRWEAANVLPVAPERISLARCRVLTERAFRLAEADRHGAPGWRPPTVTDGRGRRHACGSREVIKLPLWARTGPIVLHECAHGMATDAHGPDFVAAYLALLGSLLHYDEVALRRSASEAGLKISPRPAWAGAV